MKKLAALIISFVLLLFMAGCQKEINSSDDTNTTDADTTSNIAAESSEPTPAGTAETFTCGDFVLEISNVCEIRMVTGIYDNGDPYELPVYICYPGATLSVVNADLGDPDVKPHPQWGLYDVETDSRTKLTDGMEPITLNETTDAVFNLEASVFVLKFEFAESARS